MVKYDGYAIVTGGARGMGAAICLQLAADGYDIVCNYISTSSKAKVEALAAEIREKYGHKVIAAQGDVSRFEDCQKVVQTAVDTLGEKIGRIFDVHDIGNDCNILCDLLIDQSLYLSELFRSHSLSVAEVKTGSCAVLVRTLLFYMITQYDLQCLL